MAAIDERSSPGSHRVIEHRVTITPYRDGPLLIRGPVQLVGLDAAARDRERDPIALCRCGKSKRKPFCDGTHKLIGFRALGASS